MGRSLRGTARLVSGLISNDIATSVEMFVYYRLALYYFYYYYYYYYYYCVGLTKGQLKVSL